MTLYIVLGILFFFVILIEIIFKGIKDPSQHEEQNNLNPYDSYYIEKGERRMRGMKQTAVFFGIMFLIGLIMFLCSCSVLRTPHYEYQYTRLWDGTTGHTTDIVQYDLGDTIEEIPSGKRFLITGVGLEGSKMIYAQTKSVK